MASNSMRRRIGRMRNEAPVDGRGRRRVRPLAFGVDGQFTTKRRRRGIPRSGQSRTPYTELPGSHRPLRSRTAPSHVQLASWRHAGNYESRSGTETRESREAGGHPHRRGRLRRRPCARPAGASRRRHGDDPNRAGIDGEPLILSHAAGRLVARGRLPCAVIGREPSCRDPLLVTGVDWYTARAAGVVAYALLSGGVLLGTLLAGRARLPRWPAFAVTDVHR